MPSRIAQRPEISETANRIMLNHVGTNDFKTGRVCAFGRQMIAGRLVSVTGMSRHSTDNGLLFDSISWFKQAPAPSQRDLATA